MNRLWRGTAFSSARYEARSPLRKRPNAIKDPAPAKGGSLRKQYAEQTRSAILAAARELFSERGYFSTTVDDIAGRAGVAAITVYTSANGKSGLLRALTDIWSTAPIIETNRKIIAGLTDPVEVLRVVANTARVIREDFGDIVVLMLATAPHDKDVSENLDRATARYRQSIRVVVQHLILLKALPNAMNEEEAVDILWFYFGYWGLYSLHVENRWAFDRAEKWLCDAATHSLLRERTPRRGRNSAGLGASARQSPQE